MSSNNIPAFPIKGQILSTNLHNDRFSLVYNAIGNEIFPKGQYLFYTKNGSLWYRYKNDITTWSNEFLFIDGGSSSNVKFDENGFPITGYVLNNHIYIRYYINEVTTDTLISPDGILPTVIIDANDKYIFWVPPNFNNILFYTGASENFHGEHSYSAVLNNPITDMNIQLNSNNTYLFTFSLLVNNVNKIYLATTNVIETKNNLDLLSNVSFNN